MLNLLKYSLALSPGVVDAGDSVSFTITSVASDVYDISLHVTHPNELVEEIPLTQNGLSWSGSFTNTSLNGTYLVVLDVENIAHDITTLNKSFAVKSPTTTGQILGHNLPAQTNHGQSLPVSVSFQNTGPFPTEVLVELQEWKGDYFEKIRFSDITPVLAGQTVSIPVTWTPQSSLGEKTIKLVATFDDAALEVDQNVFVADADTPIIWSVTSDSVVPEVQPLRVLVKGGDASGLSGVIHVTKDTQSWEVPLIPTFTFDYNQSFFGIIEPVGVGSYSYAVELCDDASPAHCVSGSPSSFSVSACSSPKLLVILGDGNASNFGFLENEYCVGYWEDVRQLPSISFLEDFSLVYWFAGTSYMNAVDANAASLLQSYSGNLILEGDEIALRHVSDFFLTEEGHANLVNDYSFLEAEDLFVDVATAHVILDNWFVALPVGNLPITPDALLPVNGGVSLLDWVDGNGSAMVAFQDGLEKRLLIGFNSLAMPSLGRKALVQNSVEWMFDAAGPDVIVSHVFEGGSILPTLPQEDPLPAQRGGTIGYIPHFLDVGANTVPLELKNNGSAAMPLFPVDFFLDESLIGSVNSPSIASGGVRVISPSLTFPAAGDHNLTLHPNSSISVDEFDTLNNPKTIPIWVAPVQGNAVPTKITSSYADGNLSLTITVANKGGTTISSIPVRVTMDGVVTNLTYAMKPGQTLKRTLTYRVPKKNYSVNVVVDPNSTVPEADETDNALTQTEYFCTKSPILVVDDNDALVYWESDEDYDPDAFNGNASSAPLFEKILKENGYCVTTWDESVQGIPSSETLNAFPLVVWSTGDYWNTVLDANDQLVVDAFTGSLFVEGNDFGFDHADDNYSNTLLRADFNGDVLGLDTIPLSLSSVLFPSISSMDYNMYSSSFPDAFTPIDGGFSAGEWSDFNSSALVGFIDEGRRTLAFGGALDSISSFSDQNAFLVGAVQWLLLASNQAPSSPSSLLCNGAPCVGNYSTSLSLACGGSVDPEGDSIQYGIEAFLPSAGGDWWSMDWSHRLPVTIIMSGDQPGFRTSIDIDPTIITDPLFWSNVRPDFGDVRFIQNGVELEYYRPIVGADYASYWIEFDAVAGENLIEMYFGNPSASYGGKTTPSSFFLTGPVHLVDNFDDGVLTGWTVRSGSWQESNGILQRTGGALSEDQITKDWLQRGSSLYIRAQARPTSTCVNTEVALTRDIDHSPPTYLDEFFGLNVDNACPNGYLYAKVDLDHSPGTQSTLSVMQVSEDQKNEALISRTGWMGAFIGDASASPFVKVVDWEGADHSYPYLSIANHGGGVSEADEVYTGNAPNHAYDTGLSFGGIQSPITSSWEEIGTHGDSASWVWNISGLGPQPLVGLRCRGIDADASGKYSPYYTLDQTIMFN